MNMERKCSEVDGRMTLDEAIKHCEEIAEAHDKLRQRYDDASGYSRSHNEAIRTDDAKKHEKCSQDFRQLVAWLLDLKQLRKQTKWIELKDQKPEEFEDVLVKDIDGDVTCAYLCDDTDFLEHFSGEKIDDVVEWMEIPG
jgi:hypothetical protein